MTNHEAHMAMWDWLSKNPGISKFRWPGFKNFKPIRNDCFACQHCRGVCTRCPLNWPGGITCTFSGSLYSTYQVAKQEYRVYAAMGRLTEDHHTLVTGLAIQIRDLPWSVK